MMTWLSKRLLAQREAIRYMMLPWFHCWQDASEEESYGWRRVKIAMKIAEEVRKTCLNFVEMEENDWLDECPVATPAIHIHDGRSREIYPNSGDEDPYDFFD
jgi:hypothetical protein